jgi:hypothetical protein
LSLRPPNVFEMIADTWNPQSLRNGYFRMVRNRFLKC